PVEAAPGALERAVSLLRDSGDTEPVMAVADYVLQPSVATKIVARIERINQVLGLQLTADAISGHLKTLAFQVDNSDDPKVLAVTSPWWRTDIQSEDDLAEEVIKLVGYDHVPATLPLWQPTQINFDKTWPQRWKAKATLKSAGLFEVATYSFISAHQIDFLGRLPQDFLALANPLSTEQAYLRTDLLASLLSVAERNRMYSKNFGMFEFSKVYVPKSKGELPEEPIHLGVLVRSEHHSYKQVKAVLDRLSRVFNVPIQVVPHKLEESAAYPNRAGYLQLGDTHIGWIGQLHPDLANQLKLDGEVAYMELVWEPFLAAAKPKQSAVRGRFPTAMRDVAVVVDRAVTWDELAAALEGHTITFINDYYGDELGSEKKSIAFQLTVQYPDRTPTDTDAEKAVNEVVGKLKQHLKAVLRA
ncbi:MAG TPA: hypothetical protein VF272_03750, partial [Candidatus Saccharimonadia bacterium]